MPRLEFDRRYLMPEDLYEYMQSIRFRIEDTPQIRDLIHSNQLGNRLTNRLEKYQTRSIGVAEGLGKMMGTTQNETELMKESFVGTTTTHVYGELLNQFRYAFPTLSYKADKFFNQAKSRVIDFIHIPEKRTTKIRSEGDLEEQEKTAELLNVEHYNLDAMRNTLITTGELLGREYLSYNFDAGKATNILVVCSYKIGSLRRRY